MLSHDPASTNVLIAGHVPVELVERLKRRFWSSRFGVMAPQGTVPAGFEDADVLFTSGQSAEEFGETVALLPRLRWVHTASSGVDRFLPVLKEASWSQRRPAPGSGIADVAPGQEQSELILTRTAEARAVPMAEHVLAVTIALLKRLPQLFEQQRLREWQRPAPVSVSGATVGIIGSGAVGRAVAHRFTALGADVVGVKRSAQPIAGFSAIWGPERLHDLLAASDVVVVACPLTAETRNMLGVDEFSAMKPDAMLVNVARGGIVVERELIAALEAGHLGGAALDVFEVEPLPPDDPLWSLPNVIITPHSSSTGSGAIWEAVVAEFAENFQLFVSQRPLRNSVDIGGRGY